MEKLDLTCDWDKVFPKSDKVEHSKVTFVNRYGITLAADMYRPLGAEGRLAAVAVCGPFGAVNEQVSGLYAQTLAERGFLTLAFDPSFTGESGGVPRYVASPDINTEDFCAAVDYLSVRDDVDAERIGIPCICGWGGMALNAAAIDTRIKATVTSTMYDMSRVSAKGYFDAMSADERYEMKKRLNEQRTASRAQRTLRARGRSGGYGYGRYASVCQGLSRFLQDAERLSCAFACLERRLERYFPAVVHQYAAAFLQQ